MANPADEQTPARLPHPLPCIHCRYDLRGVGPDANCPECGNPAGDTKEKTLFYRLLPSRLNTVLIGLALLVLAAGYVSFNAAVNAGFGLWRATPPDWLWVLWRTGDRAFPNIYAPWIAAFAVAAPLDYRRTWATWPRVVLVSTAAAMLVAFLIFDIDQRASAVNNLPPTAALQKLAEYEPLFAHVPVLLGAVRVQQIARRLPAVPAAWLGPLSLVCCVVQFLLHAVQISNVLNPYATPLAIVHVLGLLITLPLPVFASIIFVEARAISRHVDGAHPYTSELR